MNFTVASSSGVKRRSTLRGAATHRSSDVKEARLGQRSAVHPEPIRYNGCVTDREQAIRELVWEWAPLGEEEPTDPHLPKDEYDWLIRGVERELDEGADARQVAIYLTNAVRTKMA
jgi:hypothetical protein